jgi:hypothetical protein
MTPGKKTSGQAGTSSNADREGDADIHRPKASPFGNGWMAMPSYTAKPGSPSTTVCRIRGRSPACHSGTSWRTR